MAITLKVADNTTADFKLSETNEAVLLEANNSGAILTAEESESVSMSVESAEVTLEAETYISGLSPYSGVYVWTPTTETQTIPIKNKTAYDDIMINPIPSMWLPPSAELVASAEETINLSSDTSYDSWTPTTTNTSIKSAGSARAACNYKITTDYQDTALIGLCLINTSIAYPSGTTYAKGYSLKKAVCGICHYAPIKVQDYTTTDYFGAVATITMGLQSYYSSASAISIYHAASYGIGPTGVSWGTSSNTSTSARTVGFTRPAIYARCHSSYFSTTAAAAVDSANTNITFTYKIYTIDKEESPIYKAFDASSGLFFT